MAISAVGADHPKNVTLGSGHRGLVFTMLSDTNPKEPPYAVAFACNLKPGFFLSAGYVDGLPDTRILRKETLSPEYVKSFPITYWSSGTTTNLYSFGDNAAFVDDDLYRIEDGHIRIYLDAAQQEARKRYGLQKDQIFLGAFDGRVFFWEQDKPQDAYFRTAAHTYRFKLHERVTKPLGMSKGDPDGDLALRAVVKPSVSWYPSPRTFEWIVLNFKDAKQIN
jgi:hypothetical protein